MNTILLADDEDVMRLVVRTTLDDVRYRIVEVADGLAALATARSAPPDLLILDWMMPGMTGPEVAAAVRAEPALASTPIIFLTAKGQVADRAQVANLGATAYLVKPFSPLELIQCVEAALP